MSITKSFVRRLSRVCECSFLSSSEVITSKPQLLRRLLIRYNLHIDSCVRVNQFSILKVSPLIRREDLVFFVESRSTFVQELTADSVSCYYNGSDYTRAVFGIDRLTPDIVNSISTVFYSKSKYLKYFVKNASLRAKNASQKSLQDKTPVCDAKRIDVDCLPIGKGLPSAIADESCYVRYNSVPPPTSYSKFQPTRMMKSRLLELSVWNSALIHLMSDSYSGFSSVKFPTDPYFAQLQLSANGLPLDRQHLEEVVVACLSERLILVPQSSTQSRLYFIFSKLAERWGR